MTRTTPDGSWTYSRAPGTGAAYTTTITDPMNNATVVQFQSIYEAQRDVYNGSISPANLLGTTKICYNGTASNCTTTAITLPITQRNLTTVLPGGLQSEHDDFSNTYGFPTETDDYDFGASPHGPLLKKILATYAALGNNIHAFRQLVTVQDGSGITVSKVNYNYDETAVVATSGTPQHVAVAGIRGNLTSVNNYVNATTFLIKSSTYFDTGTVKTAIDVNGSSSTVTYNYPDASSTCGNAFPTSVDLPLTLTRSMTWNCTGGVQISSTDENSKVTTTAYTDPFFWRPVSVTDPANAVTNTTYTSVTQMESSLSFNGGASARDVVSTLDNLGRTKLTQTRQAPGSGNFDSTEIDYDNMGMTQRVTLPYAGTLGQTNPPPGPATTTTYDALGRPLSRSDSGGGSTTYSYSQNDVLVTSSPAPASESTKKRQFEYDALGRLTFVCELTTGTGSGACAQSVPQTGFWTKYTYDAQGNLKSVVQNAQVTGSTQTRTYAYDWMGRRTSETNPEFGVTSYVYDTNATCGTYNGDLVKRVDAVGDITCSTYDALHRQLSGTYPSGTYAAVTPQKYFVYDAATINTTPTPTAMVNTKNRLAEAYTCFAPCSTKLTDVGLSYSARGEISDAYESTPHSGGYYHVNSLYWENGAPKQLSSLAGLPTITYGSDGEGRLKTVSASSGQNPVSNTTYNTASLPTALSFGSGDSDAFTYDPNTNRKTQYQFNVNGQSLTAALAWNASGTLRTQNITDALNTADTQNCTYLYDDLTRLQSANCGSVFAQTFSYDAFSNIKKSGSYSFQPTYDTATNRILTLPGNPPFTVLYDLNGNVTNDSLHTYAWDSDGRPVTTDSVGLTYDALGRMVEQNRSGAYTQFAYGPSGEKLGIFSGQSLQKALVRLPGNAVAVYNSSGLLYYGHADFLGSIRLGSTPARATYFDVAYAPFGETYSQLGSVDPAYTGQWQDTGHRQDTAAGLYDFPLREYSVQGRWPSPDPLGSAATCPKDPQTQNLYAYVRNNPMSFTDPTGGFIIPGLGGDIFCDPFFDPFCSWFPIIIPSGFLFRRGGIGGGERPRPRLLNLALIPPGLFGASVGGGGFDCPGTTDCSYYDKQCDKVTTFWARFYYCQLAPPVCKNAGDNPWSNCVRLCLQIVDRCQNVKTFQDMIRCDGVVHAICGPLCTACTLL